MKKRKKQALTRANLVLSPDSAVDSTRFVLVQNKTLHQNTEDKKSSTTYRYGNMARTADFDIIAKMSSNGKISKPICKCRGEKTK